VNILAIIQARMSSSRLPGKVLLPLAGKPVLEHVVERLSICRTIDKIVVATTKESSDDLINIFCKKKNIACYRGSLDDVLDRYYQTAKSFNAKTIIRITADCPAIDPIVVDAVVSGFLSGNYDLYGLSGQFPDGLDCTVFSFVALEKAWKEAKLLSEREHVTPYIEKNPHLFKNGGLEYFKNLEAKRWTLDEPDDYEFLKRVFNILYSYEKPFYSYDILDLLVDNPKLESLNNKIIRNFGYLKSLENDGEIQ
jgi:spore coat polysaccharide biosynthesis protein SpsF